jgi:hypothetical protein
VQGPVAPWFGQIPAPTAIQYQILALEGVKASVTTLIEAGVLRPCLITRPTSFSASSMRWAADSKRRHQPYAQLRALRWATISLPRNERTSRATATKVSGQPQMHRQRPSAPVGTVEITVFRA